MQIANTVRDSIVDGPGLRFTVFVQGCPHHCPGCQNPQTWEFGCGTHMEEERIFQIVRSNPLCRGVTFSGGEPFAQPEGFTKLAKLLREAHYEVASYSGYTFEQLLHGSPEQRALLEVLDVLIDGPYVQQQRSLELYFRGSRNQRILDVPRSLAAGEAVCCTQSRWTGIEE